ncbi:hypothetical protein [Candidatus Entotheonella palauensis]|nr:hypothetical protein [Candidatus Entotheonella palauensis]
MQDMQPDTKSHHDDDVFRFAQKVVQEMPECRESRIAEVQRTLNNHHLILNAEVLASRIIADPLHQVHCDL